MSIRQLAARRFSSAVRKSRRTGAQRQAGDERDTKHRTADYLNAGVATPCRTSTTGIIMSIGGQKLFIPKPPEKGSFPLDHDGECRKEMIQYLECLKDHELDSAACRSFSQTYLKCRMDKKLMAKEDWKKLGFSGNKSS